MKKNTKHSQEAKDKISAGNKGYKHTDEAKAKISIANKGKKLSPEHIEKLRISSSKPKSQAHKDKISEACRGNKNAAGRPFRIWTAEEEATLHELLESGAAMKTIMKVLKASHTIVTRKLQSLNLVYNGWTQDEDEQLLKLLAEGCKLKVLQTALNKSQHRIKARVKGLDEQNGTNFIGQVYPGAGRYRIVWSADDLNTVQKYVDGELARMELIKALPYSHCTINRKLIELGIK